MAPPKKRLGKGAMVSVTFSRLHPGNVRERKYPALRSGHDVTGLKVVGLGRKLIRGKEEDVVLLENDSGTLFWCKRKGSAKVDVEGPLEDFFGDGGLAVPAARDDYEEPVELPAGIQDALANHRTTEVEVDPAEVEVDDDNAPAPENVPVNNDLVNFESIFDGWGHPATCYRRQTGVSNVNPKLNSFSATDTDPSLIDVFKVLFMPKYIKEVLLPQTNINLTSSPLSYGEFLRWIGIWLLIATVIGPERKEFWSTKPVNPFEGAPFRVDGLMSRKRFDDILHALTLTDRNHPQHRDKFFYVRQMIAAWNENMKACFSPGWINCLDESMSVWTNKFTCPGFMFVPRKPWPFGNEYHTICCCVSGILWRLELVEGKDRPPELSAPKWDDKGKTVGLLLRLCEPIFATGRLVILDSGFCVLSGITQLKKRGVFASALIKRRRYWPKHVPGCAIQQRFNPKEVGSYEAIHGRLEEEDVHVFCFKEPNYTVMLMSSYGTNSTLGTKRSKRKWSDRQGTHTKEVQYPEVVDNHYKYRHHVDDHNGKRHSPISLEKVWATKKWEHRVFSFLLSVTEVNAMLAMEKIYCHPKQSQLDFRKRLAYELIYNDELGFDDSPKKQKRRAAMADGHELKSLPPYSKFQGSQIVAAESQYPQRRCFSCGSKKCRTYCVCTPGKILCTECYGEHKVAMAE